MEASKTGYTPSVVRRTLRIDLTAPTLLVLNDADVAARQASAELQIIAPTAITQTQGDHFSQAGYEPVRLIDGSGLSTTTPDTSNLSSVTHTRSATTSWATNTEGSPTYFGDSRDLPDPQFVLTLDTIYSLSELVIWGYGGITNEASDFTVEFSTDGGTTYRTSAETVKTNSLAGTGHARLSFVQSQAANAVRLTITNNAAGRGFSGLGGDRVGLGEIRFVGRAVTDEVLTLTLDDIADDNAVNIAEKAAGFTIGGGTGSVSDVSVTVTVGTTALAATSGSDGTWSVSVPAGANYITAPSVDVTVEASRTGYTPSVVRRTLRIDLTAPTLLVATITKAGDRLALAYDGILDGDSVLAHERVHGEGGRHAGELGDDATGGGFGPEGGAENWRWR